VGFLLSACGGATTTPPGEGAKTDLDLRSAAFEEGGAIPARYTCDGQDVSPPLSWSSSPDETRSLALIADDPDAPGGTFVHWVIYNLPPDTRRLPEDVPNREETLPSGAAQGVNGAGSVGYMGPCPPSGTQVLLQGLCPRYGAGPRRGCHERRPRERHGGARPRRRAPGGHVSETVAGGQPRRIRALHVHPCSAVLC
jgi:Raf kinase inhibitor-like YbhB/YbcL family protein